MKKIITLVSLILIAAVTMLHVDAASDNDDYIAGKIIVNNVEVNEEDVVYFSRENDVWVSLRSMFEALGATVTWNADADNITIFYNNHLYLCEFIVPNDKFPDNKYIYIKDTGTEKYLYLNPMGLSGAFKYINDRVYLSRQSMGWLLYHLRIDMNIDSENQIITVSCGNFYGD